MLVVRHILLPPPLSHGRIPGIISDKTRSIVIAAEAIWSDWLRRETQAVHESALFMECLITVIFMSQVLNGAGRGSTVEWDTLHRSPYNLGLVCDIFPY